MADYKNGKWANQIISIDEITNVYTVGATAFALFGNYERTIDKWQLDERHFAVATKAVNADRDLRQQTIAQFISEWNKSTL